MSSTTTSDDGGDRLVDAMVAFCEEIFTSCFVMDPNVRRQVAKQLLASGKFVDYAGHKFDLLAEASRQFGVESSARDPFNMQRQRVVVKAGITPQEKTQLMSVNQDVELRFMDATLMPHGLQYGQRIIDTQRCLSLVDHREGVVLDVGGNYAAHSMSSKPFEIHSCTLLEGESEFHRHTSRDVTLAYAGVDAENYCVGGVERCDVQAKSGISIHTLPNIDPELWPVIFERHDLEHLVAVFHYDIAIETDTVGYMVEANMHWYVKDDGYVHFYFENDSSHGYDHRHDWLIKYGSNWMATKPDWPYVVYYQIDFIDGGRAQASMTRLEKATLGAQEVMPMYRYLDLENMVELVVPKFDPGLGKSLNDPRAYVFTPVRTSMAMFSYLYRFGLANDTERPDLPLSADRVREHAHMFNHVRKVNGVDITAPVRMSYSQIDDVALGAYLLIVKRAAMNKVIYGRYTNHMLQLQRRWGKENVATLIAKSFSYVAIAPFILLASSMAEITDLVALHMRTTIGEGKVLASAQEMMPYRMILPMRPVHGEATRLFVQDVRDVGEVQYDYDDIDPQQFYGLFKDTMDEATRRKVERYLRDNDGVEVSETQITPKQSPRVGHFAHAFPEDRQQWVDAYRAFDDYISSGIDPPKPTGTETTDDRTAPDRVWEFYSARVYEYAMYQADVGLNTLADAKDVCGETWTGDSPNLAAVRALNVQRDMDIKYFPVADGLISGMTPDDNESAIVIDPFDRRHYAVFHRDGECRVLGPKASHVFTCESLKIFNYLAIGKRAYKMALNMGEPRHVAAVLRNGVPGCGKTYAILTAFTLSDVILVTVKTTRDSVLQSLSGMDKFKGHTTELKKRVRTVDSANMHGVPLAHVLFVDEGLMAHSGALTMAVAESQPTEMRVFGDTQQIGMIDRGSGVGTLHFESLFYWTQIIENNESMRSPADATRLWSSFYPPDRRDKIKTFNPILRSITFERIPDVKDPLYGEPEAPYVNVSVLRSDRGKLVMLPGFVDGKLSKPGLDDPVRPVLSVHESQGETFLFVSLYRMNIFSAEIFNSAPHLVVAFSRHMMRMRYRSPIGPEGDMAAKLATQAMQYDEQYLRDAVLPAPQWLIERMQQSERKVAKYLS